MPQPLEPMLEHVMGVAGEGGVRVKVRALTAGPARTVKLLNALTVLVVSRAWFFTHGLVMVITRAISRAPLVIDIYVKSIREKSISPNSNSRKSGTTIANSGS